MKQWFSAKPERELLAVILVVALFITYAVINPFHTGNNYPDIPPDDYTAQQTPTNIDLEQLSNLTNNERKQIGIPALIVDDLLNQSAEAKCNDMVTQNYYAHSDPSGNLWTTILKKYVPYYNAADENIDLSYTYTTASQINSNFMNSPVHKAAILSSKYTHVGYASCIGQYKDNPAVFVVEHFDDPYVAQ